MVGFLCCFFYELSIFIAVIESVKVRRCTH